MNILDTLDIIISKLNWYQKIIFGRTCKNYYNIIQKNYIQNILLEYFQEKNDLMKKKMETSNIAIDLNSAKVLISFPLLNQTIEYGTDDLAKYKSNLSFKELIDGVAKNCTISPRQYMKIIDDEKRNIDTGIVKL